MRFSKMKESIWRLKDYIFKHGEKWDKLAPNINDIDAFVAETLNIEPSAMLLENSNDYSVEYELARYCANTINHDLRKDENHPDLETFLAAFDNYHTKKTLVLYRGVCPEVFCKNIQAAENLAGVELYDKAFLNTSLIKGSELNYTKKLRILVPKGTKAIYLGRVNGEEFYEVIVTKGAKLKIISRDDCYYNCKLLETD
ncbi:TPA: ADP-ribosyltransferase [Streptococcus suis]